ncbi:MAG: indolepyruvate ferredoxin oxidoreductase family protein [Burkholderiales bacterium]|jgi:indolepyruvate ferredoxin oxidoreductase|nr:indolepyruvate ferredoxin oxidoreductase family protein [Burkholderiales bacterium]
MALAEVTLDDKYTLESGRVYLTGIQALTRLLIVQRLRDAAAGWNTAGFVSGFQGSPLNNMDKTLWEAHDLLARHHVHFRPGQNEELAAMGVWGSQQVALDPRARYEGVFGMWYGKWAGLARCGDVLLHGNSAGASPRGGVLLVCGDDHMARSSTIATQSETMLHAPMIPVLAPSGVQEYLDLGLHAFAMSRYSGSWTAFKALDDTVECSASVSVDPARIDIRLPEDFRLPPGGLGIRLPDQPLTMERRIHDQRLPAVLAYARANRLNFLGYDSPHARLGVVAAGKSWLDVRQALAHLGIDERAAAALGIRVLKLGLTWPLEPQAVHAFALGLEEILVVEEKRPVIEDQLRSILYHWPDARRPRILGKRADDGPGEWLLPPHGELNAEQVALALAARLRRFHADPRLDERVAWLRAKEEALAKPSLSPQLRGYLSDAGRVPWFCSGCPHNSSTRVPEGSEAIAGVGCHFMATYIFPGNKVFSPMGTEGAAWVGHAPFTDMPHVFANMGDGTYYHSGLLAVRAAVAANVPITFKILYNDATAATGGQPLPGPLNVPALTRQLEAEGVGAIVVVTDQPEKYGKATAFARGVTVRHRDHLDAVQRELRATGGVSALVYDQTCAAEKRRRRKRGRFPDPPRRSFINTRVCEGCGDCSVKSNCVSVIPVDTEFGRKRAIDQSSCNKDFSCQNGFCPSFVSVEGGTPRRGKAQNAADERFSKLPDPALPALDRPYSIVVAGVGGTGIITVGALLGMAAHLEGKGVSVLDMTGVAQKGGAVTTYVRIGARPEDLSTIRIAAGEANAVIGSDLLVVAENAIMTRMQRGVTRAVLNTNRMTTVAFIRNPDLATPWDAMADGLREAIGADAAKSVDATRLVTSLLGDSLATNIFLLGYAFQMGLVPVSREAILRAIELNGAAVETNRNAFAWGRLAYCDPDAIEKLAKPAGVDAGSDRVLSLDLDAVIARRVEYLTGYQNAAYARRYADFVARVRAAEGRAAAGTRLTEAVARNYFKLLAIKDEYEVARLFADGEFERQVAAAFEGDYRLRYHMAPPLWVKADKVTGAPVKRSYGPWMRHALKLLARFKGLRGTWLDPFGHSAERRLERQLVADYERTIDELLRSLGRDSVELAAEIASIPASIRGYGHVKLRNLEAAREREAELLAAFRTPAAKPMPIAA